MTSGLYVWGGFLVLPIRDTVVTVAPFAACAAFALCVVAMVAPFAVFATRGAGVDLCPGGAPQLLAPGTSAMVIPFTTRGAHLAFAAFFGCGVGVDLGLSGAST